MSFSSALHRMHVNFIRFGATPLIHSVTSLTLFRSFLSHQPNSVSSPLPHHILFHLTSFPPSHCSLRRPPTVMVHITPQHVFTSPAYQQWLHSLSPSSSSSPSQCTHFLLNSTVCAQQSAFLSSATQQIKLNWLCPSLFPLHALYAEQSGNLRSCHKMAIFS